MKIGKFAYSLSFPVYTKSLKNVRHSSESGGGSRNKKEQTNRGRALMSLILWVNLKVKSNTSYKDTKCMFFTSF